MEMTIPLKIYPLGYMILKSLMKMVVLHLARLRSIHRKGLILMFTLLLLIVEGQMVLWNLMV